MQGVCIGCEVTTFVVEYINNGINKGNYCIECMCCPECGEVLPPDRVAFMQSVFIPKRNRKSGNKMMMSVPAKVCAPCILKQSTTPNGKILMASYEEEWDVQP